ncbi:MAG TPA: OmpA family protein [Candidatus Methylacidiphilales bacterium]|nr:OmpA family protein [Candidatus Methylacidiphilales bacterium]
MLAAAPLRAVPGDADNSQDYPGFPRQPGFLITDFAEDNPAEADFPISQPLPLDASHVESVHVRGHRFIIRYQTSGSPPTVYQTQLYYEKLAATGGYQVAKSGAVGDVTETFCRTMADHDIWVYLEPCNDVNVITVVEAPRGSTPIPAPEQAAAPQPPPAPIPATTPVTKVTSPTPPAPPMNHAGTIPEPPPAPPPVVVAPKPVIAVAPKPVVLVAPKPVVAVAPKPVVPVAPKPVVAVPPPAPAPVVEDANGEALYTSLVGQGRIVVPFVFEPGKDTLEASSQALVDRIVAMMKQHPDLSLRIEGHTDNSGDPDDNMRLSAERAIAVQKRIVAGRVDPKRLDAVGVGGLQPLADNSTVEGREKNRRIELVVWKRYSHRETVPATQG